MGIPAFFRQIVEKYPKIHSDKIVDAKNEPAIVGHFFVDFNSVVYDVFNSIDKSAINSTLAKFETHLIAQVVKKMGEMIKAVAPTKTIYIALDGVAPRAKMIQQRWRRYKSILRDEYQRELKEKYGIKQDDIQWTSVNISAGTKFMKKLSVAIKKALSAINKTGGLSIIFSDSSIPGEGEHKFLPMIRQLVFAPTADDYVCIYSPDADMIVLAMATHKHNTYIMRRVGSGSDATVTEKNYQLAGKSYLYISIDMYRRAYLDTLGISGFKRDEIRLITDYIFLTFMGGNDFVLPLPYLRIKEERQGISSGLKILMDIYIRIMQRSGADYLIRIEEGKDKEAKYLINMPFFKEIIGEIAKSEDYYMRGFQMRIDKVRHSNGSMENRKLESEAGKTPYEIDMTRFEHYEYYSKLNPYYEKYFPVFEGMEFNKPKNVWKASYYRHLFRLNPENTDEYNKFRSAICANYLESLVFTLRYYFEGVPSWTWFYRFQAPPTASDLSVNLAKFYPDMNVVKFEPGMPFKPFDQLMMILPQQYGAFLPKEYAQLMKGDLLPYYPISFELEVMLGGKFIYSEPVLPIIDARHLTEETAKIEGGLVKEERERNILHAEPFTI